jgi:hypothetical protein
VNARGPWKTARPEARGLDKVAGCGSPDEDLRQAAYTQSWSRLLNSRGDVGGFPAHERFDDAPKIVGVDGLDEVVIKAGH